MNFLKIAISEFVLLFQPRWMKNGILELADALSLPTLSLPTEKRELIAEFICKKKNECMFMTLVILLFAVQKANSKEVSKESNFILSAFFGEKSAKKLTEARVNYFQHADEKTSDHVAEMAMIFVNAMCGNYKNLLEMNDFNECVEIGRQVAIRFNWVEKKELTDLAMLGLGEREFFHIFLDDEIYKWVRTRTVDESIKNLLQRKN